MEVESYEVWYLWDQEDCWYYGGVFIKFVGIQEKEEISSRGWSSELNFLIQKLKVTLWGCYKKRYTCSRCKSKTVLNFSNKFGPFVAIRPDKESRLQRKVVAIAGPK